MIQQKESLQISNLINLRRVSTYLVRKHRTTVITTVTAIVGQPLCEAPGMTQWEGRTRTLQSKEVISQRSLSVA